MDKLYDLDLVRNMKKLIIQLDKPLVTVHDYDELIESMELVFRQGRLNELHNRHI